MLFQLLMIGYFLTFIFKQENPLWTGLIIFLMLLISSWISLHCIKSDRKKKIKYALISLLVAALPILLLITIIVIPSSHWYRPSFIIPLAGMILANAMNTIGIAAERFQSEVKSVDIPTAKKRALNAALIPLTNSFLAVGLVSLPGMMTGQILSGIDPLIAVRYQVVVMTMVMGSGGLSSALFLQLCSSRQ